MTKTKKNFLIVLAQFKKSLKARWKKIILFLILFLIPFFFILFSLYGSLWVLWPQNIKASIAINRLALSIYNNPDCRDFCYFEQLNYEKVISKSLNNKKISKHLFKVIFNEEDNLNWRLRVLEIILKNEISDLDYFLSRSQEFINNQDVSDQIKQKLILNFKTDLDYQQYLDHLKLKISKQEIKGLELEESLSFLLALNELDFSLLLEILNKSNDVSLTKHLILKTNSNNYYSTLNKNEQQKYLEKLEEVFLKFNNYDLRSLIIFSSSDFLSEASQDDYLNLLQNLYSQENCDQFSKFLIADILNSHLEGDYEYPEIEPADWENYYNLSN